MSKLPEFAPAVQIVGRRGARSDPAGHHRHQAPAARSCSELNRLLDHPEGRYGLVWKLDRLSRSLKDVLHITERIATAGAGFRSITQNIDTTTPAGRMMMQMVGALPSSSVP